MSLKSVTEYLNSLWFPSREATCFTAFVKEPLFMKKITSEKLCLSVARFVEIHCSCTYGAFMEF